MAGMDVLASGDVRHSGRQLFVLFAETLERPAGFPGVSFANPDVLSRA
jgi:hypothetical protein